MNSTQYSTCRSSESPLSMACCLSFTMLGLKSGSLTLSELNVCRGVCTSQLLVLWIMRCWSSHGSVWIKHPCNTAKHTCGPKPLKKETCSGYEGSYHRTLNGKVDRNSKFERRKCTKINV